MTRYFFNIQRHDVLEEDPDGAEFETLQHAIQEAVLAARELLAEKVRHGDIVDGDAFKITTADGVVVHNLPLKSVLRLK